MVGDAHPCPLHSSTPPWTQLISYWKKGANIARTLNSRGLVPLGGICVSQVAPLRIELQIMDHGACAM